MGLKKVAKLSSYLFGIYIILAVILVNIVQLMPDAVQAAEKKTPIGATIQASNVRIAEVKPTVEQLPEVQFVKPIEFKTIEPVIAEIPLTPEQIAKKNDLKMKSDKVRSFLTNYGAPLAEKSEYLVEVADKYGLDYRLVAAISIIESGGGKKCSRPYNAWGWGGVNGYTFTSWENGIDTVSLGLKVWYYDKGAKTPNAISKYYNPDSAADWAAKVNWVMAQM